MGGGLYPRPRIPYWDRQHGRRPKGGEGVLEMPRDTERGWSDELSAAWFAQLKELLLRVWESRLLSSET